MLHSTKHVDRMYAQSHLENTYVRLAQLKGNTRTVSLVISLCTTYRLFTSLHKQALCTTFRLFISLHKQALCTTFRLFISLHKLALCTTFGLFTPTALAISKHCVTSYYR
jgi:hypothetical protein